MWYKPSVTEMSDSCIGKQMFVTIKKMATVRNKHERAFSPKPGFV